MAGESFLYLSQCGQYPPHQLLDPPRACCADPATARRPSDRAERVRRSGAASSHGHYCEPELGARVVLGEVCLRELECPGEKVLEPSKGRC